MTQGKKAMANPKGNEASLRASRFKAAWNSGSTRTIRVPIALADATLEYARQLDKGIESLDTMNKSDFGVAADTNQFIDTSDSSDEIDQLKAEVERLQNELGHLRSQIEALQTAPSVTSAPEIELPEPAEALNLLKGKRKKSKADLGDVEVLWEILEELTPDKGN